MQITSFLISQIFWLFLTFGLLYYFTIKYITPKMLYISNVRNNTINEINTDIHHLKSQINHLELQKQSAQKEHDLIIKDLYNHSKLGIEQYKNEQIAQIVQEYELKINNNNAELKNLSTQLLEIKKDISLEIATTVLAKIVGRDMVDSEILKSCIDLEKN